MMGLARVCLFGGRLHRAALILKSLHFIASFPAFAIALI